MLVRPGAEEELRIRHALSIAAKCEVDVVRLERANAIVARHGRPILERSPGLFSHFAATALLDDLDMEPLLIARQKRYLQRIATGVRRPTRSSGVAAFESYAVAVARWTSQAGQG